MRSQRLALLTAGALTCLALTGCGADNGSARGSTDNDVDTADGLVINGETIADKELWEAAKDGKVSLATAFSEDGEKVVTDQFTEDTGIEVEFVRLPTPELFERVVSENAAGRLSFDVIRVTDIAAADEMAKEGVFATTSTPFDDQLTEDGARDIGNGMFLSSFYALYTFVYNNQIVTGDDIPETWEDLLNPVFEGKVGIVNPNGSGGNLAMTDMQIELFGEDYLQGTADLNPRIFDSVSVQGPALGQGELSVATMPVSSAIALQDSGAPVTAVISDEGVSAAYTPFGLTAVGADNPAAQVFVNWQMSKAGQSLVGALGIAPARSDVEPEAIEGLKLPKPGDDNFIVLTPAALAERQAQVLATWNQIFNYSG